jgi:hypothetical protein
MMRERLGDRRSTTTQLGDLAFFEGVPAKV